MTNIKELIDFAEQARQRADAIAEKIQRAELHTKMAGDIPPTPHKSWNDHIVTAIATLKDVSQDLDGGGYDHCPMLNAVHNLLRALTKLRDDYHDQHKEHYFIQWKVNEHHFLLDKSRRPRVLAFDDERSAQEWLYYHQDHRRNDLEHLDPSTVPTSDQDPIRTTDLLDAIDSKADLSNQSAHIRLHFQKLPPPAVTELPDTINNLPNEQKQQLLQELTG